MSLTLVGSKDGFDTFNRLALDACPVKLLEASISFPKTDKKMQR